MIRQNFRHNLIKLSASLRDIRCGNVINNTYIYRHAIALFEYIPPLFGGLLKKQTLLSNFDFNVGTLEMVKYKKQQNIYHFLVAVIKTAKSRNNFLF